MLPRRQDQEVLVWELSLQVKVPSETPMPGASLNTDTDILVVADMSQELGKSIQENCAPEGKL